MQIVAFANQKGGVGKTTSAVNSAVVLASRGYRTLLLDLDPQGNATSSLGIDKADLDLSMYDVMLDETAIEDARLRSVRENLDVAPTTSDLAAAEIELVGMPSRERRLALACHRIRHDYDVALIDCPPSLGLLTLNGLTAAGHIVIPIQCEFLALEGVTQLIHTIDLTRRQLNPTLDLLGVLMTMFDARTRLSTHVVEEVRKYFPDHLFETVVPRSVRLAEAPSYGQAITEYDPSSRGGSAYDAFVDELAARLGLPVPDPASAAHANTGESTS
ncbi:MAG TPA: AAA family ATPase [Thermomicrobiales bacterium]|jgi:chromosome partitioning protein|nr:AAA family ATPase [Thermomicrobiales bacterium]